GERGDYDGWTLHGDMVYSVRHDGPELVRRPLGGDRVESLVPLRYALIDPGIAVSPDGRHLLWTAVEDIGSDLKLLEDFDGL
ncbi:MAG: hypothetical protein AAFX50_22470, partial [Acidobacteriota bacterium]